MFFDVGRTVRAGELFERALASAVALHGKLSPLASMPALLLAETRYERNELESARALIADYLDVSHGLGYVDKLIAAYVTRARIEASDGQYEIAHRTLDDGERCARITGFARLQAHLLCERMRQLSLTGNASAVVDAARGAGLLGSCAALQPYDGVTSLTESLAICWSYAARANGDIDGAIRLLKNWYRFVFERQCLRSAVRLGLELANLFASRQDASAAQHYLSECVRLAGPQGSIRPFIDAGGDIRRLLQEGLQTGLVREPDRQHAQRLLQAFASDAPWLGSTQASAACRVNIGDFSDREVDILELAAGDVPNREIARRLVISEHTVKWYWKQIFSKLNVHRRLQAVISARAAGVIH